MSLDTEGNVVVRVRKACSQIFFVFTGAYQNVLGMGPMDFLNNTGLVDRNVVMLKDPHRLAFRLGISQEIPDLQTLICWQKDLISELSHIRHVYCLGVSAGGIPAILTGHALAAETVWSFSARPPLEVWGREYDKAQQPGNTLRKKLAKAVSTLRRVTKTPAGSPFDTSFVNMSMVEETVERLKTSANGKTQYRLYYVPSNRTDTHINGMLSQCPGAVLVPVEPSADYTHKYYPDWDHMVLPILNARGDLKSLFPARA